MLSNVYDNTEPYKILKLINDEENGTVCGSARLLEVTAEGANYTFNSPKGIIINNDAYVNITDKYNIINNDFTLRIWLDDVVNTGIVIAKIHNTEIENEYISIKFYDGRFHAFKYSFGMVSHYISFGDYIDWNNFIVGDNKVFILLKHIDDMIDLYAEIYNVGGEGN